MSNSRWDWAAAGGLVGFGLWQLGETYQRTAPPLAELRRAHRDDVDTRQRLLDADLLVGGLAVIVAAWASFLTRSWIPAAMMAAGFAWMCLWHRSVMGSLQPDDIP